MHRNDPLLAVCGKIAIVRKIIEAERSSKLHFEESNSAWAQLPRMPDISGTWFLRFARMLFDGVERSAVDRVFEHVAVINFNYDRCFEFFLTHALSATYSMQLNESHELVRQLRMWHPYGTVGALSQDSQSQPFCKFGGGQHSDIIDIAAQIRTFTEQIADEKQVQMPRLWLRNASAVLFLGFSFNASNLKLIKPLNSLGEQAVYATGYGLSETDCKVAEAAIGDLLNRRPPWLRTIRVGSNMTCDSLLKEYGTVIQSGQRLS